MDFELGKRYSRDEIHASLGGSKESYLPTKDGRVVCGAFRPDGNPDAPNVILPGLGVQIRRSAEIFATQTAPIPIFLKKKTNEWKYVGNYRVSRLSRDPLEVAQQAKRAGRLGDVSMVLFLERVLIPAI